MKPSRPAFRSSQPTRRLAPGPPPQIADTVTWTRTLGGPGEPPAERYRILYRDANGEQTERTIELRRLGHAPATPGSDAVPYLGVTHDGRFKTLRADRVLAVLECLSPAQLTGGVPPSLHAAITYATVLPPFPLPGAVYRVKQTHGTRTWTVDLNRYTCTCPEKRIRAARGYAPGQLGMVCDHMAKALFDHLPASLLPLRSDPSLSFRSAAEEPASTAWSPALLDFLRNPRRISLDNLT